MQVNSPCCLWLLDWRLFKIILKNAARLLWDSHSFVENSSDASKPVCTVILLYAHPPAGQPAQWPGRSHEQGLCVHLQAYTTNTNTHIRTRWQDHVPHGFQKKVFQSVPGGIARQHLQATWLAILGENPDFKACSKNGPREPWAVHSARKSWFYHLKIILTQ